MQDRTIMDIDQTSPPARPATPFPSHHPAAGRSLRRPPPWRPGSPLYTSEATRVVRQRPLEDDRPTSPGGRRGLAPPVAALPLEDELMFTLDMRASSPPARPPMRPLALHPMRPPARPPMRDPAALGAGAATEADSEAWPKGSLKGKAERIAKRSRQQHAARAAAARQEENAAHQPQRRQLGFKLSEE